MSHNTRRSSNLRAGDPARKLIPSRKNQRYITSPPTLPRFRQSPRKSGDVGADSHEFTTPQAYYRRQYFEALDLLISELKRRFQQKRGLPVAAEIEKTLLSAAHETFVMTCSYIKMTLISQGYKFSCKCFLTLLKQETRSYLLAKFQSTR